MLNKVVKSIRSSSQSSDIVMNVRQGWCTASCAAATGIHSSLPRTFSSICIGHLELGTHRTSVTCEVQIWILIIGILVQHCDGVFVSKTEIMKLRRQFHGASFASLGKCACACACRLNAASIACCGCNPHLHKCLLSAGGQLGRTKWSAVGLTSHDNSVLIMHGRNEGAHRSSVLFHPIVRPQSSGEYSA